MPSYWRLGPRRPSAPPLEVSKFVVAGASKRGWTTWTTGAVDPRVVGIEPVRRRAFNRFHRLSPHVQLIPPLNRAGGSARW